MGPWRIGDKERSGFDADNQREKESRYFPGGPGGACRRLGFGELELPGDFGERRSDGQAPAEEVNAIGPEGDQFAPTQARVGGAQDQRPISMVDRIGELPHLVGGDRG